MTLSREERINEVIELLRKDKAIQTHFAMALFVQPVGGRNFRAAGPQPGYDYYAECQTACCLAGWFNVLEAKRSRPEILTDSGEKRFRNYAGDSYRAAALLDLTSNQRMALFFMEGTVFQCNLERFDDPEIISHDQRYDAAIYVLEKLRDENRVDWEEALNHVGFDSERYREDDDE